MGEYFNLLIFKKKLQKQFFYFLNLPQISKFCIIFSVNSMCVCTYVIQFCLYGNPFLICIQSNTLIKFYLAMSKCRILSVNKKIRILGKSEDGLKSFEICKRYDFIFNFSNLLKNKEKVIVAYDQNKNNVKLLKMCPKRI